MTRPPLFENPPRLFSVRVGNWWFMNWHLYRQGIARNKNYARTPVQWVCWKCVFCGKGPHEVPRGEHR